jgi:hypothetical protein
MFYKVVIFTDYDGSNKLGRIPSSKDGEQIMSLLEPDVSPPSTSRAP